MTRRPKILVIRETTKKKTYRYKRASKWGASNYYSENRIIFCAVSDPKVRRQLN